MPWKPARRTLGYLIWRHDARCCYCGTRVTIARGNRPPLATDATRDHVRPRSLGGSSHPGNLALCCHACNQSKGNLALVVWLVLRWAYGDPRREDRRWLA